MYWNTHFNTTEPLFLGFHREKCVIWLFTVILKIDETAPLTHLQETYRRTDMSMAIHVYANQCLYLLKYIFGSFVYFGCTQATLGKVNV